MCQWWWWGIKGNGEREFNLIWSIFDDVFVSFPIPTPKYRLFVFFILSILYNSLFLKSKDNDTNQNIQTQTPQTITRPWVSMSLWYCEQRRNLKVKTNRIIFFVHLLIKLKIMYTSVNWMPNSLKKKGREGKWWAVKFTWVRQ